jgi:hypothetical protein
MDTAIARTSREAAFRTFGVASSTFFPVPLNNKNLIDPWNNRGHFDWLWRSYNSFDIDVADRSTKSALLRAGKCGSRQEPDCDPQLLRFAEFTHGPCNARNSDLQKEILIAI